MKYVVRHLHLELSSLCNARCPLCPRNFQGFPYNMGYKETNLDLDTVKQILPPDTLRNVRFILINGNFGDFVMNPQSVDIIRYLHQKIYAFSQIEVHTNGSARDRDFWSALGEMKIRISFNIDGIGETNNLYRQDTNFDNIIKNAQAFIKAGGYAIWNITEFEHNRHQLDQVKSLAQELGFAKFSIRPTNRDIGPVYNRQGEKIHWLKNDWKFPDKIDAGYVEKRRQDTLQWNLDPVPYKEFSCWAKNEKSIYIASDGHVYPCCWVGHSPHTYASHTSITHWNQETKKLIANNHAPSVGLEAAMEWFEQLSESWNDRATTPGICIKHCEKS